MMNRVKQLLEEWSRQRQDQTLTKVIEVELSDEDYARLRALTELYSERNERQIISELISAMLDEIEEALPYLPGKTIVAEDEFGDPVYEDVGLSRKFEQLKKQYTTT